MGMSLDAHIAWGVELAYGEEREHREPWCNEDGDEEVEPMEWLAAQLDPTNEPVPPVAEYSDATQSEYHAYWDAHRAWVKAAIPGLDIRHSGSCDFPGYILIVEDSHKSVEWSEIGTVQAADCGATEYELYAVIERTCEAAELKIIGEPGWKFWATYG